MAVEPEPFLRERAEAAAAGAPVAVRVIDGMADRVPLDDASADAAVLSLVLCSVPDQAAALAEVRRILRPGGELRFYEHVRSERPGFARFQQAADLLWPRHRRRLPHRSRQRPGDRRGGFSYRAAPGA